ncbi:MAG: hypothetical protein SVU32_02510, partial [Candidatus Nanohaloarchaea archaeon]|nr:hypothetical protein [Candidatus Nanohaloarchaea archaeon]
NPCALSIAATALVLVLPSSKDVRKTLLAGLSLTLGVFISYLLTGLGLIPSTFTAWMNSTGLILFAVVIAVSGTLLLYTGLFDTDWQLPLPDQAVKIGGTGLGTGLLLGLLATPCTGQIYLAIIGMVNASGSGPMSVLPLLILYNTVFVTPFIVVTIGTVGLHWSNAMKHKIVRQLVNIAAGILAYATADYYTGLARQSLQRMLAANIITLIPFLLTVLLWAFLYYRDRYR